MHIGSRELFHPAAKRGGKEFEEIPTVSDVELIVDDALGGVLVLVIQIRLNCKLLEPGQGRLEGVDWRWVRICSPRPRLAFASNTLIQSR